MKTRQGSAARRRLEFRVVCDQVRRNKERFIARLQRWIRPVDGCLLWTGAHDGQGYGVLSFRYRGRHIKINVPRIVTILRLCGPIPLGVEAGHIKCVRAGCVIHLEPQHYLDNLAEENGRKNGKRKQDIDCPF